MDATHPVCSEVQEQRGPEGLKPPSRRLGGGRLFQREPDGALWATFVLTAALSGLALPEQTWGGESSAGPPCPHQAASPTPI